MIGTIDREELKTKIDRGDKFYLVETLAEEKFHEGHLPGAVNLPPERIGEVVQNILPDHEREIVLYCGSSTCMASLNAAEELVQQGYTNVRRYVGGKKDWMEGGLPMEMSEQMVGASSHSGC